MRIIVTGGRDYTDARTVARVLAAYQAKHPGKHTLVHGGATGADTMAAAVAYTLDWEVEEHLADWETHGKGAGPIRNKKMADAGADGLIAFPGGRGTANMIACARKAGIPVWEPCRAEAA
jgi:predicted Rossmann-fold nucleotide-binding protein